VSAEAIGIVGYAYRLPGDIVRDDDLWRVMETGEDLVGEIPEARIGLFPRQSQTFPTRAAYLPDVSGFDAPFFKIKGLEARTTDPRQRLLLETVWHALEHAAIDPAGLRKSRTGVFIGAQGNDYLELAVRSGVEVNAYWNAGLEASMLANRISYVYHLTGPSMTIGTACSSSLEALAAAVDSLRAGHCETAIVGAANLILTHTTTISAYRAGMLAEDGRCRSFDKDASGFVRGEGVIVMVLKKTRRAAAEGVMPFGLIRAAATSHAGHGVSLTAPNPRQQTELLRRTWSEAGIDPATIGFVEAHGTGTRLGDSIEAKALADAFAGVGGHGCTIGSIKTNLGHLEAAAGLAGVLKVLLSMARGRLPKLAHFSAPNPMIDLGDTPLQLASETRDWPASSHPRRAGVSSFGFGGSGAHVLLEEGPSRASCEPPVRHGFDHRDYWLPM